MGFGFPFENIQKVRYHTNRGKNNGYNSDNFFHELLFVLESQIIPEIIKIKPKICWVLMVSFKKTIDPISETRAVKGRNAEALETGILLITVYQIKATNPWKKPKNKPIVMFFGLVKNAGKELLLSKRKNIRTVPAKNCLPPKISERSYF